MAPEPGICRFCGAVCKEKRIVRAGDRFRPEVRYWHCECPEAVAARQRWVECQREMERQQGAIVEMEQRSHAEMLRAHNLSMTGIPAGLHRCTFDNFVRKAQPTAHDAALKVVKQFLPTGTKGLVLHGERGTGKTHLAAAIAMAIFSQGYTVRFATLGQMLRRIRATFERGAQETEMQVLGEYEWCDLLVVDDVDKPKGSEWVDAVLFDLINERMNDDKTLVMTCNAAPLTLFPPPVRSRLSVMCQYVELKGEDWRLRRVG